MDLHEACMPVKPVRPFLCRTTMLCQILKHPNPTQSGAAFRYERVLQLQLTGTSIVWNVPNQFGKTVHRYVIPTAIASPVAPSTDLPEGGYRIQTPSSRYDLEAFSSYSSSHSLLQQVFGKVIPLSQLQITRWPHPLYQDDGQSPVRGGCPLDRLSQSDRCSSLGSDE